MQGKPALLTDKQRPRSAVVTGRMPATATPLRGMPGVHPSHRTTLSFRLVGDEDFQLGEGPAMQPTLLFRLPLGLHPTANVGEVFEHDRAARCGGLDDLLAQEMIAVPTKAGLSMSHPTQVPLSALGASLLQGPALLEVAAFDRTPALLAQKGMSAGDRRLHQAQVDAHDLVSRLNRRRG